MQEVSECHHTQPTTSMPWFCYLCTVRAGHADPDSFPLMGPPSSHIQINGSSYTHGQQLPTMSIVPTGSAGSYSKSAVCLASTSATRFALGGLRPVCSPISCNSLSVRRFRLNRPRKGDLEGRKLGYHGAD